SPPPPPTSTPAVMLILQVEKGGALTHHAMTLGSMQKWIRSPGTRPRASCVVGVAQAINKKCGTDGSFTEQDEKDFSAYLAFSGIVLHNAQLYETSQLENRRNQAQCCTVFVADGDATNSFSKVFHMEYTELGENLHESRRERDVGNPINYMYAQYVKNTMEPLNIRDVTKDKRFPWTSDNMDTSTTQFRSLLCTPIKNGKKDKVIGVCQLLNKMDESTRTAKPFNRNDEQFLEAFAIFCGLGIQNTQMYETVERALVKQEVTLEVLSYHACAAEEETQALQ
ncbi:hypothetical protein Z043_125506, partial [Scleropages formosus]